MRPWVGLVVILYLLLALIGCLDRGCATGSPRSRLDTSKEIYAHLTDTFIVPDRSQRLDRRGNGDSVGDAEPHG
jgi:hypothetical protein